MWFALISIDRIFPLSNYTDEIFLWQHHCTKMVFIDWLWKVLRKLWKRKITLVCLSLCSSSHTFIGFNNMFQIRMHKSKTFHIISHTFANLQDQMITYMMIKLKASHSDKTQPIFIPFCENVAVARSIKYVSYN